MSLFQNSLGFLPPYFGSGLKQRNFGFVKSAVAAGDTYIVASGGSVARDGDYLVHTFKSSDTLNITQLGSKASFNTLQYLIVGGGGGGGADVGGGGSGGELKSSTLIPTISSYPIVVGSGGSGSTAGGVPGSLGGNSSFNSLVSIGGGGGGSLGGGLPTRGAYGGGAFGYTVSNNGANGLVANKGGDNTIATAAATGGGGGGAGGNGSNSIAAGSGFTSGGVGLASSISGTSITYSAGGKGAGDAYTGMQDGASNTGNGGDAAGSPNSGKNGGSGVVIIRYYSPQTQYIVASGGSVSRDGDYLVHTFTGSDTLNITQAPNNAALQYLLVAGGGGGGQYYAAGGGGAGGVLLGGTIPSVNSYSIVIGAGGSGATVDLQSGINGSNSTFYGLTAIGGGGGGGYSFPIGKNGGSGGGGGGEDAFTIYYAGGTGIAGQGNGGGLGTGASGYPGAGGGGGGYSTVGGNAVYQGANGIGGTGLTSSISGSSVGYAGGGGGGGFSTTGGTATQGGGAGGLGNNTSGQNATVNTGSGGGGAGGRTGGGQNKKGGDGGSGILIVRYLSPENAYISATGGTVTRDGDFIVHTFNGSDTLTVTQAPNNAVLEYFIVAGGGGGGGSVLAGGGGGAGGYISGGIIPTFATYSIVIGAGGALTGSSGLGANGSNSTAFTRASIGGGGGAPGYLSSSAPAGNGGSGGGAGALNGGSGLNGYPGTGTLGQGFNGGLAFGGYGYAASAGGGGGGAVGVNADGSKGGNGGIGKQSSISGTATYYAGGGGGGSYSSTPGTGGLGGGANGGTGAVAGSNATANTGGGGGGGAITSSGGSGIVIVRYKNPNYTPTLSVGLISYYPLEGNANDSLLNNNGSPTNVTWVTGKYGQGGNFNGSNSIITIPSSATLNSITTAVSINCWVKMTTTANALIVIRSFGSGAGASYFLSALGGQFRAGSFGGTGSVLSISPFNTGQWYNLTLVYVSNVSLSLYVDGVLQGTDNTPGAIATSTALDTLTIGNNGFFPSPLNGVLDAVGIWGKALNATEITELNNGAIYPFYTPTLILGLSSSYSLNGNANKNVGLNNGTATNVTYGVGVFDQAAVFDGTAYISVPSIGFPTSVFSFSIWVNTNTLTDFTGVLDKYIGGASGWLLDVKDNKFRFIGQNNISFGEASTTPISTGVWYNVIVTYDGTNASIYLNGVFCTASVIGAIVTNNENVMMGGDGVSTFYLQGKIDEFNFYNRVLTLTEIADLQTKAYPFT